MQWMATLGTTTLPNTPLIGDFRNDGSKEIVVAVGNEYIEVLEGETGSKEPGTKKNKTNDDQQNKHLLKLNFRMAILYSR